MAKNDGEELHIFNYDVFISFRGEDTRHTFAKILHKELKRKRIRTFIDDEMLNAGNIISPTLSKAIVESTVLIVVLSENYASSTWCLQELVEILNCLKKGNQQLVYPIFYHVDPSHVRHQKGKYGEAMTAHENRFGKNSDQVRQWRSALNEVCQLVGLHISTTGDEINDVEKIVEKVYAKIISKPLQGKDPIGFEQRIQDLKSLLDIKSDDLTVSMLGIYGLGGIGKTEIAKALYNKIVHKFEAAIFIANVREKSNRINGLEELQMALLSNMSEVLEIELSSTSRGIYEIKRRLGKKKVLLVLDDVNDREQLNNLAGECDWFGSGSRIIITTRDGDLLRHLPVEKTYKMVELNDQQSLELFCQNAFGKSNPKGGYEDMSNRAVNYANGLPLALKILGTDLATEDNLEYWEYALEEYKRNLNPLIQDVLQRSYERLQPNAKQVFLDIACFFKGERKEYVEMILKEFKASQAIKVLVQKSLITVENGCLNMNGLIQDLARDIVHMEAPNDPGKRSRLWSHEDIIEVLTENMGSDAIEGIMLDPLERKNVEWSDGTAFKNMRCLRILIVRNTSFSTEPKHLPNHLRVVDWEEYPSTAFPPEFHPKNIIVFNLCKGYFTLGNTFQKFLRLTTLNFSRNQSITELPNVSGVPNLREIRLDNCYNLIKVDESIGFLQKLSHFSASECTKLRDFPRSMYLPSLEVLNLKFCTSLEHFPDIKNNMDGPLKIYMRGTAIEKLPDSISNLTGLVCINMRYSMKLRYLPHSLFMLPNLVTFKTGGCSIFGESLRRFAHSSGRSTLKTLDLRNRAGLSDEDVHAILKCFPELEELIAWDNNFVSLPECIKESVHLTSLDVSDCRELQKIPKYTHLRILNVNLCLNLEEISELPPTIQKVYARYCRSLTPETLDMLWSQVKKEILGLEVVMCQIKTPEWFDWSDNGGNPCFWCRGKFPILALALVFNNERGTTYDLYHHHQFVELHLVINGQCVPQEGSYNFRMEVEHVLVCDLRLLFSEEEWLGLDAHMVHDWNLVQVSYEASSTMTLSSWGVYVYKQETKMEDVRFKCPDPECPDTSSPTAVVVPMLSMEAHEGTAEAPPPPTVAPSSGDDDPLLQALMLMKKDESCESEAKSKLYWKLIEEHKSLRKKFEQLENQSITARDELDSWKLQYHDLLEQLNTTQSDSKSALRDSGKEGGKKHEKVVAAVLKGRGEELRELYDAEIEGFQKSQESHDLMSVVYLKGVRDGVLEAQATLLALDMDRITTPEERVTRDVEEEEAHSHIEEQHDITHEDADHDSEISSPADSQVDNPGETSYLSRRHRVFRRFFLKK